VVVARKAWRRMAPRCKRLLGRLLRATGRMDSGVTLLLAPDRDVRRLNRIFLGKDRNTDVLSFPARADLEPGRLHLGDIAVSVPHLLGYDHEVDDGEMRRLERRLLSRVARVSLDRRRLSWG